MTNEELLEYAAQELRFPVTQMDDAHLLIEKLREALELSMADTTEMADLHKADQLELSRLAGVPELFRQERATTARVTAELAAANAVIDGALALAKMCPVACCVDDLARPNGSGILEATKANAWDEGYATGENDHAFEVRGSSVDPDAHEFPHANPYRDPETIPAADDGAGLDMATRRPGCHCFMWDEDCPEHPNHQARQPT